MKKKILIIESEQSAWESQCLILGDRDFTRAVTEEQAVELLKGDFDAVIFGGRVVSTPDNGWASLKQFVSERLSPYKAKVVIISYHDPLLELADSLGFPFIIDQNETIMPKLRGALDVLLKGG